MRTTSMVYSISILCVFACAGLAQEATITVHADQIQHRVSRYLTGACIEDVNHEIYGGIDTQMIFGESFQEPEPVRPLKGFATYGGHWSTEQDGVKVSGGDGPKLVSGLPAFSEGQASVEMLFPAQGGGNAGFIVKVGRPGPGRDDFDGYEVALETSGTLVLGRHRHNWEPIRRVPCDVPVNAWITLSVRMKEKSLEVLVNGRSITQYEDTEHPLTAGTVGLRAWQRDVRFRHLSISLDGRQTELPFELAPRNPLVDGVSGMWRAVRRGTVTGEFTIETQLPFVGNQSQRISFAAGEGELGIENQGLNRWGMNFVAGQPYEGRLWVKSAQPVKLFAALESRDGERTYAETRLEVSGEGWRQIAFVLKPDAADNAGRFALKLKQPGSLALGYVFLQPGEWGRFKSLPLRKDVVEGLIDQGITVLRYGGSMVNAAEYRWKKMIGPRDRRPPYHGTWYPYSSNGWGILDFLNLCEAAGFLSIPDFNLDESPQDMADFVEYVNGPPGSAWGRRRVTDGHPAPYHLKYLELGNEEQVNDNYWRRFEPLAKAIWAKDPEIILVVGDFSYGEPIHDPDQFNGAAGEIHNLSAHRKILQLAKQHNREVWFDIHTDTEGPRPRLGGTLTFVDALEKIADGARHRVVIFEFNAGNHSQRRALANAEAINTIERDGRIPIALSANCLQPDGQNDNGWDQGLLFLNPAQVWFQPPGYVTRMISRRYQPLLVASEVVSPNHALDVTAKRSDDGKILTLQIVNQSEQAIACELHLSGFKPAKGTVEELSGPLRAVNTASKPDTVRPTTRPWSPESSRATFAPQSLTILQLES